MKRVLSVLVIVLFLGCALNIPGRLAWAGPDWDLIAAASDLDIVGVKAALRKGANVNVKDKNGYTALIGVAMESRYQSSEAIIILLLKAGANVNAKDKFGETALLEAGSEIIPLLLKAGADVNSKDIWGNTALIRNAGGADSHTDAIRLLLKAGANVNARNKNGNTALIKAVKKRHPNTVRLLLKAGADAGIRNNDGNTALEEARMNNHPKLVSIIKDWIDSHSGMAVASTESSTSSSDNSFSSPSTSSPSLSSPSGTGTVPSAPSPSGLSKTEAQEIAAQAAKQAVEQANAKNAQELAALQQKIANQNQKPASPKAPAFHSSVDRPTFTDPKNRHMFALVIGVEHYPGGLPSAQFADRDARAVSRTLIALGVPPDHIKRLTDGTATRGRIREGIRWLGRNAKPDSTVWVYFSGHGAPGAHGHTYLVPSGGDPNDLGDTAYRETRFYNDLNRLPAKRILVALDACFSGKPGRSVLGKGMRPLVTNVRTGVFPRTGKVIAFSAARADQEAGPKESAGHGLFTYYFLKGIDGGAESGGRVTVGSLSRYLKRKVPGAANLYNNTDQVPQVEPRPVGEIASVRIR